MAKKVITVPANIERSAPDGFVTYRSLDTNTSLNKNLPKTINAVVEEAYLAGSEFEIETSIDSMSELKKALSELIIRFDTKPDFYTKKDYQLLIGIISKCFGYLYSLPHSDPEQLQEILDRILILETLVSKIEGDIDILLKLYSLDIQNLYDELMSVINSLEFDNYEAGSGIAIEDEKIVSKVTDSITVTGVTVGNLTPGYTIDKGTNLMDLLKAMLTKLIGCTFTDQSVSITNISKSTEYGDAINITATANLKQAVSVSLDPLNYPYTYQFSLLLSSVNGSNDWGWSVDSAKKSATGTKTYSKVTLVIKDTTFGTYNLTSVSDDDRAVDNQNNKLDQIPSTTGSIAGTVTITPTLKCYIGAIDSDIKEFTSEVITSLPAIKSINLGTTSTTLSGEFTNVLNGENNSICLAVPYTMSTVKSAIDEMSFECKEDFKKQSIQVQVVQKGGATYPYNIWILEATGAKKVIKTITL